MESLSVLFIISIYCSFCMKRQDWMLLMCKLAVLIASALRIVANMKPFCWLCVCWCTSFSYVFCTAACLLVCRLSCECFKTRSVSTKSEWQCFWQIFDNFQKWKKKKNPTENNKLCHPNLKTNSWTLVLLNYSFLWFRNQFGFRGCLLLLPPPFSPFL